MRLSEYKDADDGYQVRPGDVVRYHKPNSRVKGRGKDATVQALENGKDYVVRDIDMRPVEEYGYALVRLEGIYNPVVNTVFGFIEVGYRADAFSLVKIGDGNRPAKGIKI